MSITNTVATRDRELREERRASFVLNGLRIVGEWRCEEAETTVWLYVLCLTGPRLRGGNGGRPVCEGKHLTARSDERG
jgi:hypothetical protein